MPLNQLYGCQGLAHGSDLVRLTRSVFATPSLIARWILSVLDQQVVAYKLHSIAKALSQ